MTREQIYKAALEEQLALMASLATLDYHRQERAAPGLLTTVLAKARAALEAAAKVGDDVFVCNAVCCDDAHPDHAQELRRLLAEAEAPPPVTITAFPCPKCGGGKPGTPGKDSLCQGCWNAEYQKLCEGIP